MVNQRSFGRRVDVERHPVRAREAGRVAVPGMAENADTPAAQAAPAPADASGQTVEDELNEWKRARRSEARFPWRSLSLMASLCFGIASFALPDSMNDAVQWLLYALAAASLYAGFRRRRSAR